jgi:hypothetical protein
MLTNVVQDPDISLCGVQSTVHHQLNCRKVCELGVPKNLTDEVKAAF